MYREGTQRPLKDNIRFVQINEKVQSSEGLRRWALLQNVQNASVLLNRLSERGIESEVDLKQRILSLYDEQIDIIDEIKSAEKEMTKLERNIRNLNSYIGL